MWSATITGRIIAKKNSKRLYRNRYTGRIGVASSSAYERWHAHALSQILGLKPAEPFGQTVALRINCTMKGRLDSDMDNMLGSICDLLQDAGVLADDKQVVELRMSKRGGGADFLTSIEVESVA